MERARDEADFSSLPGNMREGGGEKMREFSLAPTFQAESRFGGQMRPIFCYGEQEKRRGWRRGKTERKEEPSYFIFPNPLWLLLAVVWEKGGRGDAFCRS